MVIQFPKFIGIAAVFLALFLTASALAQGEADTVPPAIPTGLSVIQIAPDFSRANLEWNVATDNTLVTGYNIFVDGVLFSTTTQNGTAGEPFQVTGLTVAVGDTQHSFTVSAYDAAGNQGAQSQPFVLTTPGTGDIIAPTTPTGLVATGFSAESVTFSWIAATDNVLVEQYKIYKNGSALAAATTTGQTTEVAVHGLIPDTTYTFRVAAADAAGNQSALSETLTATTSVAVDTTAPSAPTGLTAVVSATSSAITVSWKSASDNVGITGYQLFRDDVVVATTTSATHHTDSGLSPLTKYAYTVVAVDAAGNLSAKSGVVHATTGVALDTTAPVTPTDVVATPLSSSQINLSWATTTDNVSVVGYNILRNGIKNATTSQTHFSSTGLSPATAYSFAISAYDAAGNTSGQSALVNATTLSIPDTTAPSKPTGLSATPNSAKQITISWKEATDNVAVTGYKLYRSDNLIATITTSTTYVHADLSPSTRYTYSLSAFDAAGNTSSRSGSVSATTNPSVEVEPFVQHDAENSMRSKINALGNTPDPSLRIPVLFGVEVVNIYDSWGDPRGNGRTHEGTDILAPRGSYIVSPGDAVVIQIGQGANGGNYVYTANPGGEHFYYAHLDAYANALAVGQVLKTGDLIGYVGDTGNAKGGPTHLHLGIYNPTQNPFPRLKRAFTLDERLSALSRILAVARDPAADAKNLVSTQAGFFRSAITAGAALPGVITNALSAQVTLAQTCAFGKNLTIGTRGADVTAVQSILISANKGPSAQALSLAGATGYFGVLTQAALAEYQKVVNTCAAVVVAGATGVRDLTIGSRGADVTALQERLIKENKGPAALALAGVGATAYFGLMTKAALAELQRAVGITPPAGYLGPITRAYLSTSR